VIGGKPVCDACAEDKEQDYVKDEKDFPNGLEPCETVGLLS
jgi:hypothetical protein